MKISVKEKIIVESERILFTSDEKLTYRNIASNLNISIGVINYHYPKQEDLFLAIHKYKMRDLESLKFSELIDYFLTESAKISRTKNGEFMNTLFNLIPQKVWKEYYPILEMKFFQEFGVINKECIVSIVTQIQMLLICREEITTYLELKNAEELKIYLKKIINNALIQYQIVEKN